MTRLAIRFRILCRLAMLLPSLALPFLALLILAPSLAAPDASAAESAVVATDHDQATLVTDQDHWAPGRSLGV